MCPTNLQDPQVVLDVHHILSRNSKKSNIIKKKANQWHLALSNIFCNHTCMDAVNDPTIPSQRLFSMAGSIIATAVLVSARRALGPRFFSPRKFVLQWFQCQNAVTQLPRPTPHRPAYWRYYHHCCPYLSTAWKDIKAWIQHTSELLTCICHILGQHCDHHPPIQHLMGPKWRTKGVQ